MQTQENINQSGSQTELQLLLFAISMGKRVTLTLIAVATILAITVVFLSTPQYRSEVLVIAKENTGSLSGAGGQAAALAAIAGISLNSASNKEELAIATLESRHFLIGFINKHNLKRELFAVSHWSEDEKALFYKDSVYDSDNGSWLPDAAAEPTDLEAYEEMLSRININKNVASGIIVGHMFTMMGARCEQM